MIHLLEPILMYVSPKLWRCDGIDVRMSSLVVGARDKDVSALTDQEKYAIAYCSGINLTLTLHKTTGTYVAGTARSVITKCGTKFLARANPEGERFVFIETDEMKKAA
jgi:hypothetical protein